MADSVNATASLASGSPVVLLAASKPPPASEGSRPARAATVSGEAPVTPESRTADVYSGRPAKEASPESLEKAAERVGKFLKQSSSSDLQFQVDKDTGISFFQVIDPRTKEVIRQFPPEEVITMARKLREMASQKDASGVLLDKEG